jgi:hypothetical protein
MRGRGARGQLADLDAAGNIEKLAELICQGAYASGVRFTTVGAQHDGNVVMAVPVGHRGGCCRSFPPIDLTGVPLRYAVDE